MTIGGIPLTLEGLTALNGLYLVLFFLVGYASIRCSARSAARP